MAYFAYAMAWVATAVACGFAVYITQSGWPLWALVLPALINVRDDPPETSKKKKPETKDG